MELQQSSKVRTLVYVCPVDHSGTSLFVKGWMAPQPIENQAPIILVHDLEESPENYLACAERLATEGFNVYSYEMRVQRKQIKDARMIHFEDLASDLLQVVAWIRHKEGGRRPIVVGQGVGALIILYFVQGYSKYSSSMVLVSPLISLQEVVKPLKRFLIRSLTQLRPFMSTPRWLSLQVTENSKVDPKSGRRVRVPIYFTQELLIAISRSHKLFSRISLPTLLLCPISDPICRYDILRRLMSKHKDEEKIGMISIEAQGHHLLTRDEQMLHDVLEVLIPWLKTHGSQ